jgi:protocatechuate 3,4-dioxygenase beta subunit
MAHGRTTGPKANPGRNPLAALLAATFLALTASAQATGGSGGTVLGVVTDASGAPVARATVEVYPSRQLGLYSGVGGSNLHIAVSDPQGRFELRQVPPNEPLQLVVLAEGFAPALLSLPSLEPGQALERDITLGLGGALTARLVDEDNQPLEDVVVHLFLDPPRAHLLGDQETGRAFSARTGASGAVRFDHLPPGTFTLVARPPGFYQAMVVGPELADGDDATAVFGTRVLERAPRRAGRVIDQRGQPVAGAQVLLRNQQPPARFVSDPVPFVDARTDRDGRFEVAGHTRSPSIDLRVEHPKHPTIEAGGLVAPASSPVEIVLPRELTLRGQVVNPEGGPVFGASVRLALEESAPEGRSPAPPSEKIARTGTGGWFSFSGLTRGVARLYATAERWAPSAVVAVDIDHEVPSAVTLTLQQGATLTGRIGWSDGRPAADAVVSLSSKIPAYQIGGLKARGALTRTADDGTFRIDGLAPGRYQLIAFDPEHSGSSLALEQKEIELEAGDNVLNVVAPARALVSGLVVDSAGRPVPRPELKLHHRSAKPPPWRTEAVGREDGSFVFPSIPPGTYHVTGWSEGFGESSTAVFQVGTEDVTDLVVRLGAGGSAGGRIFGLTAQELGQVRVEGYGPGDNRGQSEVRADGTYRIWSLKPGRWRILARVDQGQLRRRAEGHVTVRSHDETHLDLEFPPAVRLMGRVLIDGEPVEGIEVQLSGSPYITSLTEREGLFAFDSLQPKQYTVTLNSEGRAICHREVLLEADSKLELNIETGSLSGSVVDEDGAPVVGAPIRAMWRGTRLWLTWNQPRTDTTGRFQVRYVEAGPYEVIVEADGYESASRRCRASRKGGCEGLSFTLRKER